MVELIQEKQICAKSSNPLIQYLLGLKQSTASALIRNVNTTLELLEIDDVILPCTVNDTDYESSYVCSPYNALISYSKDELYKIENRPLQIILLGMINSFSRILKWVKINKNIHVNNLLLSTNLYPELCKDQLFKITEFFKVRNPDHNIVFRSLNNFTQKELLLEFQELGFILIPSRQVYMVDCRINLKDTKQIKEDLKILKNTKYQIVRDDEITESDYPRIEELYNLLYIEKYSKHNPQFNIEFYKLCHLSKFLTMIGLRDSLDGKLYAILGYYKLNGVITTPLFGYDTALKQNVGLYRMLTTILLSEARKEQMILHFSSGAGKFKAYRGATSYIEYSAVYCKHLSLKRIAAWKLVGLVLKKIAVPLMQKYEL